VKALLKLIGCEFLKWKRKKLFQIAFLTAFIMPLFYALLLKDGSLEDFMSVVREENGFLLLIPLSAVIAANLFFEEHDYGTLKNLLCVPVSGNRLTAAKLFVVLLFDIAYELAGFGITAFLALFLHIPLTGITQQFLLTFACGILLWAAAMPCLLLVAWCNKSYIISVLIAFAYTVLGYILHISDAIVMVPLGPNISTFLPVPVIFRWLYQFHSTENAGEIFTGFYERFSPYFISTPAVFAIMGAEAAVCMLLMMKIYQKQNV